MINKSAKLEIEKVQKIALQLKFCPLIFRNLSNNDMMFSIVPERFPSKALQWAMSLNKGYAQQISEFDSLIDEDLKDQLKGFYRNNVAKIIINGRRFTVIAQHHKFKEFETASKIFIERVNQHRY